MAEMEIARDDTVVEPGGAEVGRIAHVIVDGPSGRVTDLVVARRDGTEFTLPIAHVRQDAPGVFMMHTAPEKVATDHPFEATEYRPVDLAGGDADRVVVPSVGTPVPPPASGATITPAPPRAGAFVPSSSPAAGMPVSPPPIPAPIPAPISPPPLPRFDHPPETGLPRTPAPGASAGIRAGAIRPETAVAEIAATGAEMRGAADAPHANPSPDRPKDRMADTVQEHGAAVGTRVTDAAYGRVETAKEPPHDMPPGQVATTVGQARDTAQDTANGIIGAIRANPVPAALLGIGIGWLWREHRRGGGAGTATDRYRPAPQGRTMPPASRGGSTRGDALVLEGDDDSLGEKVGDAATHAKDAVGSVVGQTQERASRLAGRIGEIGETVGDAAGSAQERVGDLTHGVQRTAGGLGSDLVGMIRANPVPATLTGLGIGWLLMNRSRGADTGDTSPYRVASSAPVRTRGPVSGYDDTEGGATDALGDAANAAKSKAGRVAEQVGEGASTLAGSAQDRVRDLSDDVQYKARVAQSWLERTLEKSPTNIGMVALSLGIAAGFTLPKTRTEDQLFGDTRDALLSRTTESIQKAQKIAQDVQKVVEDIQAPAAKR